MDEIERLRNQNKHLTDACQVMAQLLSEMMSAAGEDDPRLMELPHYVKGIEMFKELSLELKEIKGEA